MTNVVLVTRHKNRCYVGASSQWHGNRRQEATTRIRRCLVPGPDRAISPPHFTGQIDKNIYKVQFLISPEIFSIFQSVQLTFLPSYPDPSRASAAFQIINEYDGNIRRFISRDVDNLRSIATKCRTSLHQPSCFEWIMYWGEDSPGSSQVVVNSLSPWFEQPAVSCMCNLHSVDKLHNLSLAPFFITSSDEMRMEKTIFKIL